MKKIVLSLLLAFTLIPMMPFNTASAANLAGFSLEEIELTPYETKNLAECVAKAESFTLSGSLVPGANNDFYQFVAKIENGGQTAGGALKDDAWVFSKSLEGVKRAVSFSIQNQSPTPIKLNSTLAFDLGDIMDGGCYECTHSGGKNSVGDCGTGNDGNDSQPNGASRILAPIAALLGGLLFLF